MRLFNLLTEEEQNRSVNFNVSMTLDDMLDEEFDVENIHDPECEGYKILKDALDYTKTLKTKEEKIDYLMTNDEVSSMVFNIALEMAKNSYYHSEDEMVIWIDSLMDDSDDDEDEETSENMDDPKKDTSLN